MRAPYLLFLGDAALVGMDKMAAGIARWRARDCLAQYRLPGCAFDTGLPDMTPAEAAAAGAGTMVIGVVNVGGVIPDAWVAKIVAALEAGLDVAAGMHQRLADMPAIAEAARRCGRTIHDVRQPTRRFATGTGAKRSGKRLLTVGTDCAVGKKYTALAIEAELRARQVDADFRATGQTGLLIAGRGVVIDAVIADFISGAAEWLSPAAAADHWDVIEGQGSLAHPAYAAVTLGLIHGSQPDALVICHEPGRETLLGLDYPVPSLNALAEMALNAAHLTNPAARAVGISINSSAVPEDALDALVAGIEAETGLPCCDPIRQGVGKIVDLLLAPAA
ncbi:N-acetyltransferase DgcN [Flavisphingomonas formosensis]|uniref:N-acetyltransferase DgcN n=1 Tax=Flavisphingomonas formosensis TaxID=861534 RepID=UPI0012FA15F6|nr:N-acetyltransferase DgcN [Sphingomonas formosensis]